VSGVELVVVDNSESAATRAAGLLAEAARRGGHIAFSGGSTPRRAYALAAALEPDWSRVDAWLADERCVPADDDRANTRLLRETLLDHAGAPPRLHPVETALAPVEAAGDYDRALQDVDLDLVLLGIGPDGHTASLFPHAPALDEIERRAVAAEAGWEPFVARVTMTPPLFAAAGTLVYFVTGAAKAEAVRRAFAAEPSPATTASLVRGRRTIALLDRAAATKL
jgi:6-phosphogluconolactonase